MKIGPGITLLLILIQFWMNLGMDHLCKNFLLYGETQNETIKWDDQFNCISCYLNYWKANFVQENKSQTLFYQHNFKFWSKSFISEQGFASIKIVLFGIFREKKLYIQKCLSNLKHEGRRISWAKWNKKMNSRNIIKIYSRAKKYI